MFGKMKHYCGKIKEKKPLILNLTNYVTMDFMANALLALGAAPIMSVDADEFGELIKIASAINLNIGTLDSHFMDKAHMALAIAKLENKSVILDPVGAGATKIRTQGALSLLPYCQMVRGNASEIMALSSHHIHAHGVESLHSTDEAHHSAQKILSKYKKLIVIISGTKDKIMMQDKERILPWGVEQMKLVTGMGCTLTAVISAFMAVSEDKFEAATLGVAFFGLCGEQAARISLLPGSLRVNFINALYAPDFEMMKKAWESLDENI